MSCPQTFIDTSCHLQDELARCRSWQGSSYHAACGAGGLVVLDDEVGVGPLLVGGFVVVPDVILGGSGKKQTCHAMV